MKVNSVKKKVTRPSSIKLHPTKPKNEPHANFMAGPSYDINNPLLRLACVSASSFFDEPMYYKGQKPGKDVSTKAVSRPDGYMGSRQQEYLRKVLQAVDTPELRTMSPKNAMVAVIRDALAFNPEAVLDWASILRREEFIRTTPQIIMVEAANHSAVKGTGLVRKYAPRILKRGDEPAVQMAYQLSEFGKPIPNSLKRSWDDFLKNADAYTLAKYRMEGHTIKTVDVGNMAYKYGFYGYDTAIGKLMRGELTLGEDIKTWESIRSAGGSWEEAIEVMNHMALLRNLRNFVQNNVDKSRYLSKLIGTAKHGMQLPFRYLSAHIELKKAKAPGYVLDAIEECLSISIGSLPTLKGRSLILADNSGSTRSCPISALSTMNVAKIGNLMAVLTGMVSEEGVAGVFGNRLVCEPIRKTASIMDQTMLLDHHGNSIGGSTENGIWLALDEAIRTRTHWDNIFIYSDQQAGHGGLYGINAREYRDYIFPTNRGNNYIDVPKLVSVYREKVNPEVNVFMVQIAGYEDTLFPENYYRTFIIGGWSGSIIKFASRMIKTFDGMKQ